MAEKTYPIYDADMTAGGVAVLRSEMGTIGEEEVERYDAAFRHRILSVEYERWQEGACRHDDCASTDNLVYEGSDFYTIRVKESISSLFRVNGLISGVVFHVESENGVEKYPFLFRGDGSEEKMYLIRGKESDWYYKAVYRLQTYYKERLEDIEQLGLSPIPLFLKARDLEP